MIKTVTAALNAINACASYEDLNRLWASLSHVAWNDGGAVRQAYLAKRDELERSQLLD